MILYYMLTIYAYMTEFEEFFKVKIGGGLGCGVGNTLASKV